jgi:hypothetical protein
MNLGSYSVTVDLGQIDPELYETITGKQPFSLYSVVASIGSAANDDLGGPAAVMTACIGWLHQDDDAHETCSLTACLNPLHPGPCKGWKGSLFKVAPNAYHAVEAARVEKANAARVKKIEALKQAGKPIPKKLLTPIVAKPHPHAGKTANAATGEAHHAGKAVSDAAGVHASEPGKMTLGEAVKQIKATDATPEKGPKGKKPTVASKGIAAVIAQEKVTPQYKLDKAAKITPEQWNALSGDEKAIIRGELAKIQKDGFGPQQKKATELLDKLPAAGVKPEQKSALTPGAPDTITTPSGKTYQKVTLKDLENPPTSHPSPVNKSSTPLNEKVAKVKDEIAKGATLSEAIKKVTGKEPDADVTKKAGPGSLQQANTIRNITEAIHGPQKTTVQDVAKKVDVMKSGGKAIDEHPAFAGIVDKLAQAALKQATEDKMPGLGHGDNDINITTINHAIRDHIKEGKSGLPPVIAKIQAHHKAVQSGSVKTGIEDAAKKAHEAKVAEHESKISAAQAKLAELKKKGEENAAALDVLKKQTALVAPDGTPYTTKTPTNVVKDIKKNGYADLILGGKKIRVGFENSDHPGKLTMTNGSGIDSFYTVKESDGTVHKLPKGVHVKVATDGGPPTPKIENAAPAAKKTPALPKHIQDAVNLAHHKVAGAGLSKNHLVAYEKLSPEEFKSLDGITQGKIIQELEKGKTKFLAPSKVTAAQNLIKKFQAEPKAPTSAAVGFYTHMTDHTVTEAQAKKALAGQPISAHAAVAKDLAGLDIADQPDVLAPHIAAKKYADEMVANYLNYGGDKTLYMGDPGVKQAIQDLEEAAFKLKQTQLVGKAKKSAHDKIDKMLKGDQGKLSPIQKASLEHYQKYLLDHPTDTDPHKINELQLAAVDAGNALMDAIKNAKAAKTKPGDLTPAQFDSKVGELLGHEAVNPHVNLTPDEWKKALANGKKMAEIGLGDTPPEILSMPGPAAKLKDLTNNASQLNATAANAEKLKLHLANHHEHALKTGHTPSGMPLTAPEMEVIEAHAEKLKKDFAYLETTYQTQMDATIAAKKEFDQAVHDAKAAAVKHEPVALSEYDQATVSEIYGNAWAKAATAATTYGLKDYSKKSEMKAHPDYIPYIQDIGNLQKAVKNLAVAHAQMHTAELNVPTDPDTGVKLPGPEKDAWQAAIKNVTDAQKTYYQLYKTAQTKLDTIRTDIGLKKRALPKIESPAVKAAAAEAAYYKTTTYGGPNHGKATAAKSYTIAKLGPALGIKHLTPSEKKAEKLAETAKKTPVAPPKIENVVSGPPVKLSSDNPSISHIPDAVKKQITADFKGMPKGKYLADSTEDVFDNLVTLAAVHGKGIEGGLSVDNVLKTIDATHAKNLGVANSGMLEKKVADWLGTAEGKAYAESHSKPDMKLVKQLSGELMLPEGVELKPGQKVQEKAGPGPFDPSLKTDGIYGAGDFKKLTAPEIRKLQKEHMKAEGIKFSPEQIQAMFDYSSSQHAYNTFLRDQNSATAKTKQQVVDLQDAMMPAPENMLLKRGTGYINLPDGFQSAEGAMKLIGKTFQDKAFVSSTVAGESGHFSHHSLQLIIEAPKGTPGVWMNDNSHFKGTENEYLLAAGTKFHVISGEQKNGKTFLRVRVVSE